jgi:hypothetical protein
MKAQARIRISQQPDLDRAWQAADAEVSASIQEIFSRCPELTGFSVQPKVLADSPNRAEQEELFVTAIAISPRLSKEQYTEIFERISAALMQLLAERPEAHALLRSRTFARIFH